MRQHFPPSAAVEMQEVSRTGSLQVQDSSVSTVTVSHSSIIISKSL